MEQGDRGGGQQLILADARGGTGADRRRKLMDCDGFTTVCVSPDGGRMAVLTRKKRALTESLTVLDGPFDLDDDPWPGDSISSTDDPNDLTPKRRVLACYWSPDSRYLLWLSVPGTLASECCGTAGPVDNPVGATSATSGGGGGARMASSGRGALTTSSLGTLQRKMTWSRRRGGPP